MHFPGRDMTAAHCGVVLTTNACVSNSDSIRTRQKWTQTCKERERETSVHWGSGGRRRKERRRRPGHGHTEIHTGQEIFSLRHGFLWGQQHTMSTSSSDRQRNTLAVRHMSSSFSSGELGRWPLFFTPRTTYLVCDDNGRCKRL